MFNLHASMLLLIIWGLLSTLCTHCFSQQTLMIPYAAEEIRCDGNGTEWGFTYPVVFFVKNPHTLDSNRTETRFAWDEQHLYGLVWVADRQLVKLRHGINNPTLNLGDAIEIYLDPLHDSHERMDLNDYQFLLDAGGDYAIFKGDKTFMQEGYLAPKDTGLATIAFDFKPRLLGTLNDESDLDEGYFVEFALPWAALGVHAKAGTVFRLDLCVDDMDAQVRLEDLTEQDLIVPYTFASWQGDTTFGFPPRWRVCRLAGEPGVLTRAWRFFGKKGFGLLLLVMLLAMGLSLRQYIIIRRLQRVPRQSEVLRTPAGSWAEERVLTLTSSLPNAALFDRLRVFILKKMDEDLRPEDLAEAAMLSLRTLQRIFREELNTSPHQFITMIKMEKAAELLRSGQANVTEAAFGTGFTDPAYFSKVFKKYFGVSPREFTQGSDGVDKG